MLFSTAHQGPIFIWMTAAGMGMALIFTLFEMLRRALCLGPATGLLLDVLLGICCAGVFLGALVLGNYGRLRLFEILAALLGAALFEHGVQRPIFALLQRTHRHVVQIKANLSKNRLIKVLFR